MSATSPSPEDFSGTLPLAGDALVRPRAQAANAHSAHAPSTGWLRRVLGPFYFTGVFWYRFHLFGARVLPDWSMRAMTVLVGGSFFLALGRVRRAVAANLDPVLGPASGLERLRRSWRTIQMFSWTLTERYEQFVPRKRFAFRMEGAEVWEELIGSGRGFVLVTAHLGNWEVGSTLPATRREIVLHLVRETELDPRSQHFIDELLGRLGGHRYRTHFATDDPSLGVELLEALRRNEIVALQGDRPRAGGKTCSVELFGLPFEMPVGPAALARLAGVPLVPVFTLREGRRKYRVVMRAPIGVPRTPDRAADHRAALQALAQELEWGVRQDPHQWFCFRELREHSGRA